MVEIGIGVEEQLVVGIDPKIRFWIGIGVIVVVVVVVGVYIRVGIGVPVGVLAGVLVGFGVRRWYQTETKMGIHIKITT